MHCRMMLGLLFAVTCALGSMAATGDAPVLAGIEPPTGTTKPPVRPPTDAYKVLVLAADGNGANIAQTLQDSSGGVFTTTFYNPSSFVFRRPDSLLALGYQAVLTYTNSTYNNRVAFGDTLAKFVDLGGGAVVMVFADYSTTFGIGGRYEAQYLPVPLNSNSYSSAALGTVYLPSHPIMDGVTAVSVHSYATGATSIRHAPYGYRIADWSTGGRVQCAAFDSAGRRTAFLGFFGSTFYYGTTTGQWVRQMVNALKWVSVSYDAGCSRIDAPAGLVDSGTTVTPACSVYNYGNQVISFVARMRIGTGYSDSAVVTDLAPATGQYLAFDDWTALQRGYVTVSCSTEMANDNNAANDRLLDSCFVRVADVGAVRLANPAPGASLPLDTALAPAGVWRNHGSVAADFEAWLLFDAPGLGRVYSGKVDVTGLAAGDSIVAGPFPLCTLAAAGSWTAVCSTALAGDVAPGNDVSSDAFSVFAPDFGVAVVTAPVGTVPPNRDVYPGVKVRNYGTRYAVCGVRFVISDGSGPVYDTTEYGIGVAVGDSASFYLATPWRANPQGDYAARAWTVLRYDSDHSNDTAGSVFRVAPGGAVSNWREQTPVPLTPSGKAVKDGGALAYDASLGGFAALKGYKTPDFYRYDPVAATWSELTPMPLGVENKGPYKGANLCSDGNGTFYATKGNNTSGFWRYTASDSTWTQLADVPLGLSNKRVKGGTDLVYVNDGDSTWVYLLKGYKTEFYRYNTASGAWYTLADAPAGAKPKWDKGSWLAYDEPNAKLYAHKAKYHELYAYSLDSLAWGPLLTGMPLANQQTGKSKKSKDGGDAAVIGGMVYALKGGNTQDFNTLDLATMAWAESDTLPAFGSTAKKKRVKAGSSLASDADAVYALKGNKTLEFWRYDPTMSAAGRAPAVRGPHGAMAERAARVAGFSLGPNPLAAGVATLRFSLPVDGPAQVLVFDVTGRLVSSRSLALGRAGAVDLDLRGLAAGVYLVQLSSGDFAGTQKLVVER